MKYSHWCLSPRGHIRSSSGRRRASGSDRARVRKLLKRVLCLRGSITAVCVGGFLLWAAPYWCRSDPVKGCSLCCPRTCDRGPRPCEGSGSRWSSAERRSGEPCQWTLTLQEGENNKINGLFEPCRRWNSEAGRLKPRRGHERPCVGCWFLAQKSSLVCQRSFIHFWTTAVLLGWFISPNHIQIYADIISPSMKTLLRLSHKIHLSLFTYSFLLFSFLHPSPPAIPFLHYWLTHTHTTNVFQLHSGCEGT